MQDCTGEEITQDISTLENPGIVDQLRGVEQAPKGRARAKARKKPARRKPVPRKKKAEEPAKPAAVRLAVDLDADDDVLDEAELYKKFRLISRDTENFTVWNIDGVLKDKDNPCSLIKSLTVEETEALKKDGTIAGGMIPKVDGCTDAIKGGVKKVFIINGEIPHALLIELLTDEGLGTMFSA